MHIEQKLESLGLKLPEPLRISPDVQLPFIWVRVCENRAYISGHIPQNADGSITNLRGKVGQDVSIDDAYKAAQLTALSMLGSLRRQLGDLDKIEAWLRVYGMVHSAPNFTSHSLVINGFSDLIIELYGRVAGYHARSAVGLVALPFGVPVEIEAEVKIRS